MAALAADLGVLRTTAMKRVVALALTAFLLASGAAHLYLLDGLYGWVLGKGLEDDTEYASGYSTEGFRHIRFSSMSRPEVQSLLGAPFREVWLYEGGESCGYPTAGLNAAMESGIGLQSQQMGFLGSWLRLSPALQSRSGGSTAGAQTSEVTGRGLSASGPIRSGPRSASSMSIRRQGNAAEQRVAADESTARMELRR
jgi:hypothetical protein